MYRFKILDMYKISSICATFLKVAGSISDGISEIFH